MACAGLNSYNLAKNSSLSTTPARQIVDLALQMQFCVKNNK